VVDPLVSVVIPCRNAEAFVEKAVRSVMQQSYPELEIIIVDDCSTDKSGLILKQLQCQDSRIIVLENEKNLRIAKTLNTAIAHSSGQYIARMDADDICFEHRIEKQVQFLEKHANIALCSGNFLKIDEHDKVIGRVVFQGNDAELRAELLFYCPFAHPAVMMRRTALDETGLYDDFAPAEDYELWLRMAERFTLANIPENLIYYRKHANNETLTQKSKLANALLDIVQRHAKIFGFAHEHLQYHLRFLEGTWYKKTSARELGNIKYWKKELLALHNNNTILRQVFNKYISLAMLSILKSNQNSVPVKLIAAGSLVTINPFITAKHFFRHA